MAHLSSLAVSAAIPVVRSSFAILQHVLDVVLYMDPIVDLGLSKADRLTFDRDLQVSCDEVNVHQLVHMVQLVSDHSSLQVVADIAVADYDGVGVECRSAYDLACDAVHKAS